MTRRSEPTPSSLMQALKTHVWFASCPEPMQQALLERSRLWHLKTGESLFSRGDTHDALCCVVAGALRIGSIDPRDGSVRLNLYLEPYQWFGEIAMIDALPRSQDAIADTDSTVLMITRAQLEPWLDEHPAYWRDLARLACGKLRLMLTALEDNATLTIEQQLARRLLLSVTNFGQSNQPTTRRHVRLPQEYLAKMLGVSRQTINKALRAMERERVLSLHYAEVEITDIEGLVAKAGGIDEGLRQAVALTQPKLP
jgi:CRP/FNR family cyclic AMP-dependent transcriptional regulator